MSVLNGGPLQLPERGLKDFTAFFFDHLQRQPEHILLVEGATGREFSRRWILTQCLRYAKVLRHLGLKAGDVMSICAENSVEMACLVFVAFYLGLTLNPLNPQYSKGELQHMLGITRPKVIFCSAKAESVVVSAVGDSGPDVVVIGEVSRCASKTTHKLLRDTADDPVPEMATVDPEKHLLGIFSSSGTTGAAKGVALTQKAILANLELASPVLFTVPHSEVRCLSFLPWFHIFGFMLLYFTPIYTVHTVFLDAFDPRQFLSCIAKYRITSTFLVPPVVVMLAKAPLVDEYDLSSLREVYSGAAPLQADTEATLYQRLPQLRTIRQGYGMTEALALLLPPMPPKQTMRAGSVGLLARGTEVKVVDVDSGRLLGPNAPGELWFRGPQLMCGYYRNQKATEETIDQEGWLHTGDVGYYDNDGYFFIVDRLKELIKYKGFQVPPAELESLLLTHPQVKDAAVVGVPDERCGELPVAFVVRQEGATVTEQELVQLVAGQTSPAKRLHGGVRFVGEIPKNPSGKILRRILREMLKNNGGKAKL